MRLPTHRSGTAAAPATPVPLPAELADGLRAAAGAHTEELRPANTVDAYRADWRTWTSWCRDVAGVSEWTVDTALLEAYCRWCWFDRGYAATTVSRKLAGVVAVWRAAFGDDEVPRHLASQARKNLAAYVRDAATEREAKRGRGQAKAVDLSGLEQMLGVCRADTGPAGVRDAALILTTFGAGARSAEIAGLLADDVIVEADRGLLVDIRASKVTSSIRQVAIPRGLRASTDPVTAWRAWITTAAPEPGDPAFVRIRKGGRIMAGVGLSPEAMSDVIARRADQAGLDRHTAHSLRAGMATVARQAGHDSTAIATQGGWTPGSRAMAAYLRRTDIWSDNALSGVL